MFKRVVAFTYGAGCYAVFFGCFVYAIGFIGNILVPKSIDSVPQAPLSHALIVNLCLLAVFAVQHSLMARPFFKRWWTRFVPPAVERSTYVLFSSLALILLFALWEPIGGLVWQVKNPTGQTLMYTAYALGWTLVLLSTFLLNHFELFGLRQVWLHLTGKPYTALKFSTPWLYRHLRHPLYLGWLIVFWATPTMTVAHLVFAIGTSAYIFLAIPLEEKDLVDALPEYSAYRERVPMILPTGKKRRRENRSDAVL